METLSAKHENISWAVNDYDMTVMQKEEPVLQKGEGWLGAGTANPVKIVKKLHHG